MQIQEKKVMMYKRFLFSVIIFLLSVTLYGQIFDPVSWAFSYEKTGENRYELIITASVEEGSHIYSMDIPQGGPIPTSISIEASGDFTAEGEAWELTEPEELFDEAFGMKIKSFSEKAEFRQKIISEKQSFSVNGMVNYMACNNTTCSPPKDVEFSINISDHASEDDSFIAAQETKKTSFGGKGLLAFFLISMLAGFAGILTPCVFPMIPMTVAFFSSGSEHKRDSFFRALIFGFSIVAIYSSLGLIVSLTSAGAGFASALSTHWIPNLIFFSLFVIFAASFLGAFEIVLPSKWVTASDNRVDRGGILASFFLGLTTVIVSFSCTGPIVGALLVEAASGDVLKPLAGMFGFGVAFALPFTLFALFPSILGKIPKSGGWLNAVKVVLGFLMLAFSMKFLSTIDAVYSFGIISRDIFLSVWIVLFSLLGFYLMGKIKFAHDSNQDHIGVLRLFLVIVVFSFVVYLIPGLFGAPLKGLSSFLPPQSDSWVTEKQTNNTPADSSPTVLFSDITTNSQCGQPKYGDIFKMPYGLNGYFDYEQGLQCAKEINKPALIYFKGHACANCKLMEARVWSDPEILSRLRENFVIISLYVDDRTRLPEEEWFVSEIDGKIKKTIGKKNEDIEISLYKTNSLPFYVIAGHNAHPLNEPMATTMNTEKYKKWLDEGLKAFNK